MTDKVTACIVTHNSDRFLGRCLAALDTQTLRPARVLVWDNASTDGSAERAKAWGADVTSAPSNVGFAPAANALIHQATTPYILLLNPDAYVSPPYIERLERAADADPRIGSVTGKLVRPAPPARIALIDSTGHVLCRNRVPMNRGENEPDLGQYEKAGEVFGVCAAAALYRRTMLEDVRVGVEYFDSIFFAYLEDVDLDWRARLRGWRAYYEPSAIAEHERGHQGGRRRQSVLEIRHSLKNRYLMMVRNDRPADLLPHLGVLFVTEVLRLLDYGISHPMGLSGYVDTLRLLRRAMSARRLIQSRRLVAPPAVRRWLQPYPFRAKLRRRLMGGAAVGPPAEPSTASGGRRPG